MIKRMGNPEIYCGECECECHIKHYMKIGHGDELQLDCWCDCDIEKPKTKTKRRLSMFGKKKGGGSVGNSSYIIQLDIDSYACYDNTNLNSSVYSWSAELGCQGTAGQNTANYNDPLGPNILLCSEGDYTLSNCNPSA
eukprot:Pgem_evm1s17957